MTPILPFVPLNLRGTVDETLCQYYVFRVILQSLVLRFTKSTDDLAPVHLSASRVDVCSTVSKAITKESYKNTMAFW